MSKKKTNKPLVERGTWKESRVSRESLRPAQRLLQLRILARPDAKRRLREEKKIRPRFGDENANWRSTWFMEPVKLHVFALRHEVADAIAAGKGQKLKKSVLALSNADPSQQILHTLAPMKRHVKTPRPLGMPSELRRLSRKSDRLLAELRSIIETAPQKPEGPSC